MAFIAVKQLFHVVPRRTEVPSYLNPRQPDWLPSSIHSPLSGIQKDCRCLTRSNKRQEFVYGWWCSEFHQLQKTTDHETARPTTNHNVEICPYEEQRIRSDPTLVYCEVLIGCRRGSAPNVLTSIWNWVSTSRQWSDIYRLIACRDFGTTARYGKLKRKYGISCYPLRHSAR